MDIETIKQKIKEAKDLNWFNTKTEKINFNYISYKPEFNSVLSIYEFIVSQVEGWNSFGNNFKDNLNNSRNKFIAVKTQIEYFVNNCNNFESSQLNGNWQSHVKSSFDQLSNSFTFDCPETKFLFNVYTNIPNSFSGAQSFFMGNVSSITDKNFFIGCIMAYEFSLNGNSKITRRGLHELQSLDEIRNNFQKNVDTSNTQLTEYLKQIDDKFKAYSNEIDEYKKGKINEVNSWFDKTKSEFTSFNSQSGTDIKDLKKTYEELLRLKEPANYWKNRAEALKKEGWQALHWLVGLIIFSCITLYFLLWQTPEGMLKSFFSDEKGTAIKWSIVYVTFISFIAYAIRALSKVMFSSFHLARDAEEKEQLTYVYLALVKDKTVEEKDRTLIMQSLFSRADTGLLKDDGAPTMPGNTAEKIIQR